MGAMSPTAHPTPRACATALPDGRCLTWDRYDPPAGLTTVAERPPLVLLHPFPFSRTFWSDTAPALAALGRPVLCPDLPGFGGSTLPAAAHALHAMADDLAAWLDGLGHPRVALGGLSMGGYVALAFAARHPARLAALLLLDTRAAADPPAVRAARDAAIASLRADGTGPLHAAMAERLLAAGAPASLRERARMRMETSVPGLVGALTAMRERPDRTAELPGITVPALVLVGAEDAVTPPAEAHALAAALPRARLAVLPGAGHLPPLETPAAFQAALVGFLAGC